MPFDLLTALACSLNPISGSVAGDNNMVSADYLGLDLTGLDLTQAACRGLDLTQAAITGLPDFFEGWD